MSGGVVLPGRHRAAWRRDRAADTAALAVGVGPAMRSTQEYLEPTACAFIPRPRIGVRRVAPEPGGSGSVAGGLHLGDTIKDRSIERGELFGRRVGLHHLPPWSPIVRVGIAHPSRGGRTNGSAVPACPYAPSVAQMGETDG